jgi:hypothetical protein
VGEDTAGRREDHGEGGEMELTVGKRMSVEEYRKRRRRKPQETGKPRKRKKQKEQGNET